MHPVGGVISSAFWEAIFLLQWQNCLLRRSSGASSMTYFKFHDLFRDQLFPNFVCFLRCSTGSFVVRYVVRRLGLAFCTSRHSVAKCSLLRKNWQNEALCTVSLPVNNIGVFVRVNIGVLALSWSIPVQNIGERRQIMAQRSSLYPSLYCISYAFCCASLSEGSTCHRSQYFLLTWNHTVCSLGSYSVKFFSTGWNLFPTPVPSLPTRIPLLQSYY